VSLLLSVTVSPVSVAARGIISAERGLSLRFPRFIRVRDDKSIQDASTPEFLAGIYNQQQARGTSAQGADDGMLLDAELSSEEVLEDENSSGE
jgi:DNA ligase 1